jgi:hypothetical protein
MPNKSMGALVVLGLDPDVDGVLRRYDGPCGRSNGGRRSIYDPPRVRPA